MQSDYLHNNTNFPDLLQIIEGETGILSSLIEKDYWIMHVLHGLKGLGFEFELKGGTSLSKGYKIIDRFSEDIDLHIKPTPERNINENPKNTKEGAVNSRRNYYDWLAKNIRIDGIIAVERDTNFDDEQHYRSGGIRLFYKSVTKSVEGLKEGILLEVGFDTVTPNNSLIISSWAYDRAVSTKGISIKDNRAIDIPCYHPGYTFVEKLQTIATKFRKEKETGEERPNLMRQYYDVYSLLANTKVLAFIGTADYQAHKQTRFPKKDFKIPIRDNEAYLLSDPKLRERFRQRYKQTASLYYVGQLDFDLLLERLHGFLGRL